MSRRGWDDRSSPESGYERKRRFSEDDHNRSGGGGGGSSRWDEEKPTNRYRDYDNKRSRRFEEDGENDRQQRRREGSDDRPRRSADRYYSDNRYRDDDDKFHRTRSRYEQAFVAKKDPSPEWGKVKAKEEPIPKQIVKNKSNFYKCENTKTVNGIPLKYSEPVDARKPIKRKWRLYPYKGEKALPVLHIDKQSAYLFGKERKIADIPMDHLSISKQHAVLQFRLIPYKKPDGTEAKHIRPFLIDLESANGTFVNKVKLEAKTWHQLSERDVIIFGASTREYVVICEPSKYDHEDDDVRE